MIKAKIESGRIVFDTYDKKEFSPDKKLKPESILKCLHFASEMAYGNGYHKSQSFGGNTYNRSTSEIFINTFQGKLGELAVYNELFNLGIRPDNPPELDIWGKGKWEDCDFTLNKGSIRISIKSTKWFGNLLLLEKEKYDAKGQFLETFETEPFAYDYTFMVRVAGVDNPKPESYLEKNSVEIEVTGFMSHSTFLQIIEEKQIIHQGVILGTPLIVDNYYIFAQDLTDVNYFSI